MGPRYPGRAGPLGRAFARCLCIVDLLGHTGIRLAIGSLLLFANCARAQDTFSLLLFDARTGEIASAGASCIDGDALPGGVSAISTVLPGRAALHTQSLYLEAHQLRGRGLLASGLPARATVDSLLATDEGAVPNYRQYLGFSTADSAMYAYTGADCFAWAGQRVGTDYAIAGNILLGEAVVSAMEDSLSASRARGAWIGDQAVAALSAAAFPGADRRCLAAGISSRSCFVRVARADDREDDLFCDLRVAYPAGERDPIATLIDLYAAWRERQPDLPTRSAE